MALALVAAAAEAWRAMPSELAAALSRAERSLAAQPEEPGEGGVRLRRRAVEAPRDTLVAFYRPGAQRPALMTWTREVLTGERCAGGHRRAVVWLFAARAGTWTATRLDSCGGAAAGSDREALPLALEVLGRLGAAAGARAR